MQIVLSDWPMGLCREIATIDPTAVSKHLGGSLTFQRGRDDLDAFSAAIFEVDQVLFALQLYDHIPTGNFTLLTVNTLVDDPRNLETFLNWSGIPKVAVKWIRPVGPD